MTNTPSIAMVLAAGLGKRMRPLTAELPKPLVPVAGKALIDYTLDRFADAGVAKAIVNVHYRADQLESHVRDRTRPQIVISDERGLLLETGGGLKKARSHFGESPVYCANTDAILLDEDGAEACATLAQAWDAKKMDALLLLVPIEETSGYDGAGDFELGVDGRIAFRESDNAPFVFTGLQIMAPTLIDEGPDGPFSTKLLWERALQRRRLYGVLHFGSWMHVGDAAGLAAAEKRLDEPHDQSRSGAQY